MHGVTPETTQPQTAVWCYSDRSGPLGAARAVTVGVIRNACSCKPAQQAVQYCVADVRMQSNPSSLSAFVHIWANPLLPCCRRPLWKTPWQSHFCLVWSVPCNNTLKRVVDVIGPRIYIYKYLLRSTTNQSCTGRTTTYTEIPNSRRLFLTTTLWSIFVDRVEYSCLVWFDDQSCRCMCRQITFYEQQRCMMGRGCRFCFACLCASSVHVDWTLL